MLVHVSSKKMCLKTFNISSGCTDNNPVLKLPARDKKKVMVIIKMYVTNFEV